MRVFITGTAPGYQWEIFLLTHWFQVYFPRASSHPTDGKLKNRVVQDFERCAGSNNQGEDKDSENLQLEKSEACYSCCCSSLLFIKIMDPWFSCLGFILFISCVRAQFHPAEPCDPAKCLPPNCRCSDDRKPPGGLTREETPQIIMVTFDDDLEKQYYDLYNELFDGVSNPNGCPAVGTLFISHNYTDYFLVESAYSRGYEIADHTVTHQEPTTYWEQADYTTWKNEIDGQKEILHR